MAYPLTAIISDLHANTPAVEVALTDARARGVRRIVCLGDVVGYGANPRACLDYVMQLCGPEPVWNGRGVVDGEESEVLSPGLCLQGNHEDALLGSAEDFNPKARAAIEWTRDEINRDPDPERGYAYWDFIGALEPARRDEVAMFAHGSPRDPVREYMLPRDIRNREKMAANFDHMDRGVCFVGHSHVPAIYYEDGSIYRPSGTEGPYELGDLSKNRAIINVGSVGQPRDGDNRLSYVVFDGQNVTFIRLDYDHEAAASAIRAVPELPDFLADRLAVGR
ncbi:MAG: metallophosphoesterase family protein [bacterium]|nr:metallophosphoesterase family protein [bacterium]